MFNTIQFIQTVCLAALLIVISIPSNVWALGNHPDSTVCTAEKPYQAICTHSLHSLEGWYGDCYATEKEAQNEADDHARKYHNGNSRWTGIKKGRFSAY